MSQITPKYFYFDKRLGRPVVKIDLLARVLKLSQGFVTGAVLKYLTRFKKDQRSYHVVNGDNGLPAALDCSAFHSVFCILNKDKDFCGRDHVFFFNITKEILSQEESIQ